MGIADGELTSMALCWRMERRDGAGLALTSHDQALTRDGIRYRPEPGMSPAAIERSLGLTPNSAEVKGSIASEALDGDDLAQGRWDGARIALSAIDWEDPSAEPIALFGGELGSVGVRGSEFTAELHGATRRLDEPACPATSAECRAQLGDKQCRVDLAGRTIITTVIAASGQVLTLNQAIDSQFLFGRLVYLGGANCGLQSVIVGADGTAVTVRDLPRAPVDVGTRIELRHGCDKSFATCTQRFANALNFRGEPHLPGNDLLTRYPGA